MILNIVMGCLIVGIFCHANLPGYPETLNTTLKDKARLSRASRDNEGHFKGVPSAIYTAMVEFGFSEKTCFFKFFCRFEFES